MTSLSGGGVSTASVRMARTSASMDLPFVAARMRSRSRTLSSMFLTVIAAMSSNASSAINDFAVRG